MNKLCPIAILTVLALCGSTQASGLFTVLSNGEAKATANKALLKRFGKTYQQGEAGHGTDKVGTCKRLSQERVRCLPWWILKTRVYSGVINLKRTSTGISWRGTIARGTLHRYWRPGASFKKFKSYKLAGHS